MTDIFDAKILCKNCGVQMKQTIVNKNGLELRAVSCSKCGDKIIHPADLNGMEHFKDLKDKKFNVKLRMVGNSHAISIPKQIIDFMNERQREMHRDVHRQMQDVRLMFDDFDTLKLSFFDDMDDIDENLDDVDENLDDVDENLDDAENEDVDDERDNGRVRRKVRNDGKGNVDIVEQENLNYPERGVRGVRIKKIRRRVGR
ncbi:MAG: hypothetical protein AABX85_00290 [Nanoarchaeota archaeon]